jgi:hypothetical protein
VRVHRVAGKALEQALRSLRYTLLQTTVVRRNPFGPEDGGDLLMPFNFISLSEILQITVAKPWRSSPMPQRPSPTLLRDFVGNINFSKQTNPTEVIYIAWWL